MINLCEHNKIDPDLLLLNGREVSVIGCFTLVIIFPKTEYCNNIFYIKSYLVLLELLRFLLIVSKYFSLLMVLFCSVIRIINNIMYFVILRRVLLVFFVITILIGSLTNFVVPLMIFNVSYVGGIIFVAIIVVLVLI